MPTQTMNPATGAIEKNFNDQSRQEVVSLLDKSHATFLQWRETGFEVRSRALKKAAAILRDGKEYFGGLITREMGKPVTQAIAEVEKCALACDYYADHAAAILAGKLLPRMLPRAMCALIPSGWCLRSCPGIFPSGRFFALQRPR